MGKGNLMKQLMIAPLTAALLIGCSQQNSYISHRGFLPSILSDNHFFDTNVLTIKSWDGMPISGAQVLIGETLNSPFSGNFLTTNTSGQIAIPTDWTEALPVTVQAPGYVRSTYLSQKPGNLTITLQANKASPIQYEVKGVSQDLPVKNGDDQFDFGIVLPAFSKLDLLAFNLDSIISPNVDKITTLGQEIKIPSNISLPKQSERYSIVNITLDKPLYRTYFPQRGINRMVSLRARFPFKDIVDSLRAGKSFIELINQFKIGGAGIRDINIQNGTAELNIPSSEITMNDQRNVIAPIIRADETFLAVGISKQSGYMLPSDVKTIASGKSQNIALVQNTEQQLLGVVKKTEDLKNGDDRMSATLLPFTGTANPKMLPLINNPTILSANEALLPQVHTIEGVNPLATYAVISNQVEVNQGPEKVKIMAPYWVVYSSSWLSKVTFPTWPNETNPGNKGSRRLEVTFIGSQTASHATLGRDMIEAATHVTHSSILY